MSYRELLTQHLRKRDYVGALRLNINERERQPDEPLLKKHTDELLFYIQLNTTGGNI